MLFVFRHFIHGAEHFRQNIDFVFAHFIEGAGAGGFQQLKQGVDKGLPLGVADAVEPAA